MVENFPCPNRAMLKLRPLHLLTIAANLAAVALAYPMLTLAQESSNWKKDWAVQPGFALEVAVEGLNFPTSIAFVPAPGPDPKDAAFYITELQGAVKVVTNDGKVSTFADDFFTQDESDGAFGPFVETGLTSICLEPEQGYVFVTYAYADVDGSIRNSVGRFETTPQIFAIKPESFQEFRWIFLGDESSQSHQIGSCQVYDGHLYVGVGDALQPEASMDLDSSLGKVLRMTLEGLPSPDNPHYSDGVRTNPSNYIWARGFRNPFGLREVLGRLFVADNGETVDRFLEIDKDGNYLWEGSVESFLAISDLFIPISRGVSQFDFYHSGLGFFPDEFNNNFFLVKSGSPNDERISPSILNFEYGFSERRLLSTTNTVMEYRGEDIQVIVSATFGPDGLYIVPLFPSGDEESRILRMTYDPFSAHPYPIFPADQPLEIMRESGCLECHSFGESNIDASAPPLDPNQLIPRLNVRLNSSEYEATLKAVDELNREPFEGYTEARAQLLQLEGTDRIRLWLEQRLREPRFDDPDARMPRQNLTENEILILTDFLMTVEDKIQVNLEPTEVPEVSLADQVRALIPNPFGIRHLASFLLAGAIIGWLSLGALLLAIRILRRADRFNGNRANDKNS